jgi:hypothetical protein
VAIGGFFSESPLRPPDSFMSYRNEGMSEGSSSCSVANGGGEVGTCYNASAGRRARRGWLPALFAAPFADLVVLTVIAL